MSHRFVGADLQSIAKEAGIRALRKVLPEIDLTTENIPSEIMKKIVVTTDEFLGINKGDVIEHFFYHNGLFLFILLKYGHLRLFLISLDLMKQQSP